MPVGTGVVIVPPQTLPIVIPPVDPVAAVRTIMPTVTLNGLTLNATQTDQSGIAWIVTAIDGWEGPDVRVTQTPMGNDHGLFQESAYYGGRPLVIHGVFASIAGAANLMLAREQLHAAANIMGSALAPLTVAEAPSKTVWVQRIAGLKDHATTPVSFEYEIHLLAPDPRKYATAQQQFTLTPNNSAIITNVGTMESRPTVTVNGPATSVALFNNTTGQSLYLPITMYGTDLLTVNLALKSVTLNGVSVRSFLQSAPSQWWTINPGDNQLYFSVSGSGSTTKETVYFRSAWI